MGVRLAWRRVVAGVVALGLIVTVMVTATESSRAADGFDDVSDGHTFAADIAWLASEGITRGCNPPTNSQYCPDDAVTRAQMATFLVRALDLPSGGDPERFTDVPEADVHRGDIARLAAVGITRGCNPPTNSQYCPDDAVTRAQMATFLVRALDLAAGDRNFDDVAASNPHVADIRALAAAGITRGCNPPSNSNFCPDDPVTRAQMAAFLRRALGTTTTTTENRLTGTIPAQLGGLSKLEAVRLEYNRLTSPAGGPAVPVQLASITTLSEVSLHDNRLHGEVPDAVITALKPGGWINTFWLFGQNGCLTAPTPDGASILAGRDPNWNDGCP